MDYLIVDMHINVRKCRDNVPIFAVVFHNFAQRLSPFPKTLKANLELRAE